MIHPADWVCLKHSPWWKAYVLIVDDELVLIRRDDCLCWVSLDFLELAGGQIEVFVA